MFCIGNNEKQPCLSSDVTWNEDIQKWYCIHCDIYFTDEEFDKFTNNKYKIEDKNNNV